MKFQLGAEFWSTVFKMTKNPNLNDSKPKHEHNTRYSSSSALFPNKNDETKQSPETPVKSKQPSASNQTPTIVSKGMQTPRVPMAELLAKLEDQEVVIRNLTAQVKENRDRAAGMEARIKSLEDEAQRSLSFTLIQKKVTELLCERVSQLEQYTRRYSVIVKGIDVQRNETHENLKTEVQNVINGMNGTTTMADVDKFHRNGRREDNTQDLIIRFKSHSAKEDFYNNRKTNTNHRIKIQPSLSPHNAKLLQEARDVLPDYIADPDDEMCRKVVLHNPPEFVMADVHGNLLCKLKNRSKRGLFLKFSSLEDLDQKLTKVSLENGPALDEFDKIMDPTHAYFDRPGALA